MQAKLEDLKKSRELRKEGKSLREISQILNVSKGSVSAWVRDVDIPEDKKIELEARARKGGSWIVGETNRKRFRILREEYQNEGRELARLRDPDFFAGCMLYWAEGTKSRTVVQFTNSDLNMIKYFIFFLIRYFHVKYEDISIACHYYSYKFLNNIEVENYWISNLNCPESCFRKTTVDKKIRTSSSKRQERTKYGVVKVNVFDTRIVQMIYGALQEMANFKNEDWIDGNPRIQRPIEIT